MNTIWDYVETKLPINAAQIDSQEEEDDDSPPPIQPSTQLQLQKLQLPTTLPFPLPIPPHRPQQDNDALKKMKKACWYPPFFSNGPTFFDCESLETICGAEVLFFFVGEERRKFHVHTVALHRQSNEFLEFVMDAANTTTITVPSSIDSDDHDLVIMEVELPNVSTATFQKILDYVYVDTRPEFVSDNASEPGKLLDAAKSLLVTANLFGLIELKLLIESEIATKLVNVSNAAGWLLIADGCICPQLKENCMDIIDSNRSKVMESPGWTYVEESSDLLNELKEYSNRKGNALKHSEDYDNMDIGMIRQRLRKYNLNLDGTRTMLVMRLKHHPDNLLVMTDLAKDLYHKRNQYDMSIELYKDIVACQKAVLEECHDDTLATMGLLMAALKGQKRWTELIDVNRQQLAILKVKLGADHPTVCISMSHLGLALGTQREWAECIEVYLPCLEKCRVVFGEDHSNTLAVMTNLAYALKEQGRYDPALAVLLRQYYDNHVAALGVDDPKTLHIMADYACFIAAGGRYDEAIVLLQRCLKKCIEEFGEYHRHSLYVMHEFAYVHNRNGRCDEAIILLRQCLDNHIEAFGEYHNGTLAVMNNLGCTHSKYSQFDEAIELLRQCLDMSIEVLGDDHPDTVVTRKNLLSVKQKAKRSVRA